MIVPELYQQIQLILKEILEWLYNDNNVKYQFNKSITHFFSLH